MTVQELISMLRQALNDEDMGSYTDDQIITAINRAKARVEVASRCHLSSVTVATTDSVGVVSISPVFSPLIVSINGVALDSVDAGAIESAMIGWPTQKGTPTRWTKGSGDNIVLYPIPNGVMSVYVWGYAVSGVAGSGDSITTIPQSLQMTHLLDFAEGLLRMSRSAAANNLQAIGAIFGSGEQR